MPRKALKDTFGYETLGGVEVRRQIFAGTMIPVTLQVEDESDYEEVEGGETVIGAPEEPPPPKKRAAPRKKQSG